MKNQGRYAIVDENGNIIKGGFRSKGTARLLIPKLRINKKEPLKIIENE